jgi:hypothetical protein
MAMAEADAPDLWAAVARARARAEETGELRPVVTGALKTPVSDELRAFVRQVLADGTYAREAKRIGEDDPDLASV